MPLFSALTGTVRIQCEGGFPERFLNAASGLNIPLWDICYRDTVLFCRAHAKDYAALRPAARRACLRMRIQQKQGLPFAVRRLGIHPGWIAGAALFFLILQLLSSRIWVITIHGNHTVSDSEILAVLAEFGVQEGSDFSRVNLDELQLTALQKLPELSWLTVNQHGSIASVEVKERSAAAPPDSTVPANLVAACDGVIVAIHTVTGQAMVSPGDAVRRGDLLISGVMDSAVGPQLKKAAGSVVARTTHRLAVAVPLTESVTVPDRTVCHPQLDFFGWHIPLYTQYHLQEKAASVTVTRHPLTVKGVPLPLGLSVTQRCYTTTHTVTRTPAEALDEAQTQLAAEEITLQGTLSVEQKTQQTAVKNGCVELTAVYTGTQELAVESPLI